MIDEFLKYLLAEKRYSELTVRAYGDDIRQFVSFLGQPCDGFDPSLMTQDDVRSWIMALSEEKMKAASINRKISSVRSFCHYLRQKGRIGTDPLQKITLLKTPRRLPSFIEESRMGRIVDSLTTPTDDYRTERDTLIILLFYSTGIRLAELSDIHTDDFSDDFGTLRVTGKGDKERLVPVIDFTVRKIMHFLPLRSEADVCGSGKNLLFLTHRGEPLGRNGIYRIVREFLRGAGVQGKSSPHVLRHTFATHLLNSGADIRIIQELLGHTSLEATQVYTHNSIEQLKKTYKNAHPRARAKTNIK